MFFLLASKSLLNRKGSVFLTIIAMSVSIFVLLGVEHIRNQTKKNFQSTVSGVDLIVGARTGSLNLLLYSVFRIGAPTNNLGWDSYESIASDQAVKWSIPISLGDSHKGYRVIGTTEDYFTHFSYGAQKRLQFTSGEPFSRIFDVVLGSAVAEKLQYSIGTNLVLAHGLGKTSFRLHEDKPFRVVGILAPTGTPVDQSLQVSLQGMEAIHNNQRIAQTLQETPINSNQIELKQFQPKTITAVMLGLTSKIATFKIQRKINNFSTEPLTAILPGVALSELWQMMKVIENTLRLVSVLILMSALLGLSAMMLASIRERRHEIYLLRVIGAPPTFLFLLIEVEASLISAISIGSGTLALLAGLLITSDLLTSNYGLNINANIFVQNNLIYAFLIILATLIAAAIPSFTAYKNADIH
ncbi:MAG: peptide ABC transporter permease [Cellvibrionales bacterium TMED49]|nr:peptide ABC transporter permease [Porticoccaceae bacterium]OUU38026.1 MAG: peptide ABC transporter permease [Cellvibrionales bacterium TMED49]